jgi:hypothetical protein
MPCRALLSLLCALAACSQRGGSVEAGPAPDGTFAAPQGIAATSRYVLVASTAFHFEGGQPAYARGWLSVIERSSHRVVAKLASTGINPQYLAVAGERAYLVSSGALRNEAAGLHVPTTDGALDVFDFSAGVPAGPTASLALPRSSSDPRIGDYSGIALDADGKRAFIGSGTRGDLFVVELAGPRLARGPESPVALFPADAGKNGWTTPVRVGAQLAVLDFNSDSLCLVSDSGGELAQRRCESVGAYPDLLEGPLDLAVGPGGELYVLMGIANGLYRVDSNAQPFAVDATFAKTGLTPNRVLVDGGHAYVVNSVSNNLQRIELASRRSDLPFAVLPVGSNPFDLCITDEPEGKRGWVTLQASNQVAVIDLRSGAVLELLPGSGARDAGSAVDAGPADARPADASSCSPDAGTPVIGIGNVVSLTIGNGGGAGQDQLPGILQGAPAGPGVSGETLSLGENGELVVDFGDYDIVDGPGADFIVYENSFLTGPYQPYAEPARVGVAAGGDAGASSFVDFFCDLSQTSGDPQTERWPYPGCAGVRPVLAGKASCLSPADPAVAGGDAFDLKNVKLARARYLRLRDAGLSTMGGASHTAGFDLDAVVLIHYTKR